ncbi:MAG: PVC-type heme-binding CxxCH protein [Planctomycetaceae bacterium]
MADNPRACRQRQACTTGRLTLLIFGLTWSYVGILSPSQSRGQLPDGTGVALQHMRTLHVVDGLRVDLFAAEPQVASPVALSLDEQGRVFVAEQYRFNRGTEENRTRPFLLNDDLQIKTVADRRKMYQKWSKQFDGGMDWFTRVSDQVRMLQDTDGDGRADRSTVFADGFNQPLDGLAAGIIATNGKVYLTCIPHLWLLQDSDDDGVADQRSRLLSGFGVNAAFLGHDLHGLVWGPDGKLYFSVGDRGFHVVSQEGTVHSGPRSGAVFRCNPDGSEFEVVCVGLRNPQELAFDQFGNLFAADNNCDKGDHSRLVYVVEGGQSGWNMAFQTMPEPYLTGPWHAENMWHLYHKQQPAWITPPVAPLGAGPSGFVFSSGTSLPKRFANHFFLCNYTGNGGIESFALRSQGAGFEKVDANDFLKPISASDVTFGYDGRMYVSDFVKLNWDGGSSGGRIYTVYDPKLVSSPTVQQTAQLFREGVKNRSLEDLAELLNHPDDRVRLRAQYALADKEHRSIKLLGSVARSSKNQLARIHAIWGLGQIGRKISTALYELVPLLSATDPEIRAQAARTLGDNRWRWNGDDLIKLLKDDNQRVRFFAAMGLGKTRHQPAVPAVLELLAENDDKDPFVRHACVMALFWIDDRDTLYKHIQDSRPAVRMGILLALRRLADPRIERFLRDSDPRLITEAARAIHDLPLKRSLPALASLADQLSSDQSPGGKAPYSDALIRRVISANLTGDQPANITRLVNLATAQSLPVAMRHEALKALQDWQAPAPRNRVTGIWSPTPERKMQTIQTAVTQHVSRLLSASASSNSLLAIVANLIEQYDLPADHRVFADWVADSERSGPIRIAALRVLVRQQSPLLVDTLRLALQSKQTSPDLRIAARELLATSDPLAAVSELTNTVSDQNADLAERQHALSALGSLKTTTATQAVTDWTQQLIAGQVAPELQLDVLLVARRHARGQLARDVKVWDEQRSASQAPFAVTLLGGNPERGRKIFVGHAKAQCIRCHRVQGRGGAAGPLLDGVAKRLKPQQILESLVTPDVRITEGYASVGVALKNGKTFTGLFRKKTETTLILLTDDGRNLSLDLADIEQSSDPKSAMPRMDKILTLAELRDVLAFLSTLR